MKNLIPLLVLPLFCGCMGGTTLEISSVGDTMAYDKTALEAKAGETVKLTLKNVATSPAMVHDWVLVKPGKAETVAMDGLKAGPDKGYLSESPDILAHTHLVKPGESDSIEFKAPSQPGDYPYICTYPGHFVLMKGVLTVK